jgi:galactonate dehydratase
VIKLKVTGFELKHVKPRWLFLKVYTDEGITGIGEPILEGKATAVEAAVKEFFSYLKGKDPRRIEHHWQAMYRWSFYRGGPIITSAISGIEQAFWDILGKYLDQPIYNLLGGPVRDKIKVYAHVGGRAPEEYAEKSLELVKTGFKALKLCPFGATRTVDTPKVVKDAAEKVKAVREAVGDEIDIGIDCHGRLSPSMAIQMAKALEPYSPMFLEEPCLPENVDTMVTIARSTSIPVATGERLFTRWGFREVLEKQAAAILQPDLCHAGGIMECRKIAAMAEVYYAAIAPHNPLGPISLSACFQLDACTPNFLIQEQVTLGEGYLKNPFVLTNGFVEIPKGPGLGIELDEESVEAKVFSGYWENLKLFHEDGSVADW